MSSCRRLSLTPLAYLWQRDQGELLSEMVDAGLEAILIKVAGIGLTTAHLGRTLGQMQPTLRKLVSAIHRQNEPFNNACARMSYMGLISVVRVENTKRSHWTARCLRNALICKNGHEGHDAILKFQQGRD